MSQVPPLPDGWTWSIEGMGCIYATQIGSGLQVSFDGDEMEVITKTLCGCSYGCQGCEAFHYFKLSDLPALAAACEALASVPYYERNAAAKAANELQKDVTK